ncbi:MAG: DUF6577 family protein [Bacteroidota bacterium]
MKQSVVNWRVYSLVQMGLITRIGRGKFIIGEGKNFVPEISSKMMAINAKLKNKFPFLKICIWNTSALNEFMLHQPGRFYLLIEVEKEATQSIFYFLKDAKYAVFIDPTSDILEKYLPREKESLIIKSLVSEAPIQNIKGINTASLEKMLVDVFCDDVLFSALQGGEMRTLFKEALNKYSVNENKMLRYADRRRKKESLTKYLNSITNLRQQKQFTANL